MGRDATLNKWVDMHFVRLAVNKGNKRPHAVYWVCCPLEIW